MVKEYGRPVHLTFNSLYYIPEQYPEIAEIIKRCMEIGFHSVLFSLRKRCIKGYSKGASQYNRLFAVLVL